MGKYKLGLVVDPLPGDERFTGMISIPYLSPSGVTALKFRALGNGGPKYAQRSGQEGRLYNTAAYFSADEVLGVSEGEMDAVVATEVLGVPTVAVPGAKAWKQVWTPIFRDFTTVFVFGDGDPKGSEAYSFPIDVAEAIGWRARIIRCPEGEDVSSMCAQGRAEELTSLMQLATEDEA